MFLIRQDIFDPHLIVYEKAACLIRMVEAVVTEEVMASALNTYVLENQGGNTDQAILWETIAAAAAAEGTGNLDSVDLGDAMSTWTEQSG